MSTTLAVDSLPALRVAPGPEPATFSVPARHNPRLQALVERIQADEELRQLWRCANVNAIDRIGLNDHGEVHVRIVANAALRLLRLLREAGQAPGVVSHYHLAAEEAEVIVVLAAALHDLGLSVHRGGPLELSLALIGPKARELLAGLYPPRERTILYSEVMQAIVSHQRATGCLTLEAGSLHLADALDLGEGRQSGGAPTGPLRGREPATAARVEAVSIKKGAGVPVRIEVRLSDPSGVVQLGRLLSQRLRAAGLAQLVELSARLEGGQELFLPVPEPEFGEP